jgi:hypothetical protein
MLLLHSKYCWKCKREHTLDKFTPVFENKSKRWNFRGNCNGKHIRNKEKREHYLTNTTFNEFNKAREIIDQIRSST